MTVSNVQPIAMTNLVSMAIKKNVKDIASYMHVIMPDRKQVHSRILMWNFLPEKEVKKWSS